MIATIQISIHGKWLVVGTFEPDKRDIAKGIAGGGLFEYDSDFVLQHLDDIPPWRVGLRYPVSFELYRSGGWPAFLLDIFPSGAGRRGWAKRLGLKNNESADWQLLLNGAGNPPGNLRVAEAVIPPAGSHPGFTEEEIIEKKPRITKLRAASASTPATLSGLLTAPSSFPASTERLTTAV